ncbi:hypothetical protein GA0115240_138543 [Streptomyces sp. DvalAA-14]|uniref:hypothetical protein n=1 Tax=unclassified Streptomyces TaxID=2593676 RepID=UPI00081B9382|nr:MULTISPECIES: hypothetical protein [unclassified Streptomyces]MYS22166.1 hypothetical protein [Streptomyces sp. SID4948]SCE10066.1 hypothetical protein GA0115240_138543 [Streptomyces sp. DvalAA-14]
MTWPETAPTKPMSRGRLIAVSTVAVAIAVATGVHTLRADLREADRGPAASCASLVRAVTPVVAATHGADTAGLRRAMRLVVQHPECFPQDIRDAAQTLLDEPAATPG